MLRIFSSKKPKHNYQQSSAIGLSTSIGRGVFNSNSGQGTASASNSNSNQQNPNQQQNYFPNGPTTISMQNNGYRKEQTTYATVGAGDIMIGGTQAFDNDGNAVSSTGGESIDSINSINEITKNNANQTELANLNRDVNKSQEITKDTITAALNVQTTIDNRIIAALAGSEGAQNELLNEQLNIGKNTATSTKELAKLIDAPLVAAANSTANVTVLGVVTSMVAGQGGSAATLATQLLGLNYLLDSQNSTLQTNVIKGLDNETLTNAIANKFSIKLDKDLGEGDDASGRVNSLRIFDNNGNEVGTYKTTNSSTSLENITLNDLASNKEFSLHGIYNTSDQAMLNGLKQLSYISNQENNSLEFKTISAPSKGLILDGAEVVYNFILGKTPLASANLNEAKDFGLAFATTMQYDNLTTQNPQTKNFIDTPIDMTGIRFAGHSGGGDRLYMGVLAGARELDLGSDRNGDPVKPLGTLVGYDSEKGTVIYQENVAVQFYGTPSYTKWMGEAAENAGAYMAHTGSKEQGDLSYQLGHQINPGDPVADILGGNSFLLGKQSSPTEFVKSIISIPLLPIESLTPHAYTCQGVFCNPAQLQQEIQQNSIAKQNSIAQ